jgi:hypothetical protein
MMEYFFFLSLHLCNGRVICHLLAQKMQTAAYHSPLEKQKQGGVCEEEKASGPTQSHDLWWISPFPDPQVIALSAKKKGWSNPPGREKESKAVPHFERGSGRKTKSNHRPIFVWV